MKLRLLIVASIIVPLLALATLPAHAQTPLILVLENPTGMSANGFRFSPSQGTDSNWVCNLSGGPSTTFSLTASGTLEGNTGRSDTQGGCEMFLGTTQPANVIGVRFIGSSFVSDDTVTPAVFEHDNTSTLSLSAHATTAATMTPPEKVCLTTAGENTRVTAEIDCDVVLNLFILNPGGAETGIAVNAFRSTTQSGTTENISFSVNNIQWIVEETPPPPPEAPPPPPEGDFLPGVFTGLEGECYVCPEVNSFFNVPLWIAKLICVIRNLFTCALRIWLLDVVNAIVGIYNNVLSFFVWVADTATAFVSWAVSNANILTGFWGILFDLFVSSFTTYINSIIELIFSSPIVQGIINFDYITETVIDIFRTYGTMVIEFIKRVYDAVLNIIEIMTEIALALFQAPVDTGTIDLETEFGLAGYDALDLQQDGINDSKILWLFLSAAGAVDFAIGTAGFDRVSFVLIGIMSLILAMWTLNKWRDILPI